MSHLNMVPNKAFIYGAVPGQNLTVEDIGFDQGCVADLNSIGIPPTHRLVDTIPYESASFTTPWTRI